jgi:hypothetical protein
LRHPPGFTPRRFGSCQAILAALTDQPALFPRQGGLDVQHEGIGIGAQLSHDEGHSLGHQTADEVRVT